MGKHQNIINELALRQRGLVTTTQLREAGIGRRAIDHCLASGALTRLGHRVCAVGGSPLDTRSAVLAATLELTGYASHRTAAWLHGLPGFAAPSMVEVTVEGTHRAHRSPLALVHTTTWLPLDDLIMIDEIPCTGVARTLFSLAALVPDLSYDALKGAVDDAVRLGLASDPWLWWRLEKLRCRGRNGVSVFEQVLGERAVGAVTESWLEREALRVFADAGLPTPICQARIQKRGAFVARVDFLYERPLIIIEVTGAVAHSTPVQRASDAKRRNALLMQGYLVLEFTYEQIVGDPAMVVAQIWEALRRRAVA